MRHLSNCGNYSEAIQIWHVNIGNNDVWIGITYASNSNFTIFRSLDVESCTFQCSAHEIAHRTRIIYC